MKKRIIASLTIPAAALMFVLFAQSVALAGPAQIIIVNLNAPNVGFNDPTPAAPVGGNEGTTLGEQRMIAFQHAAAIWSQRLDSSVPIRIRAQFVPLAANVLGSTSVVSYVRNFAGAPQADTWYHVALANKLAGVDLTPTTDDISCSFSTNFDFYLGLDNNHGSQNDLVAVLLHEFAHGLGFSQTASLTTGALLGAGNPIVRSPDVYNRKLLDTTNGLRWDEMTNAQRLASSINPRNVVFTGDYVTAGVPNVLSFGVPSVRITAPVGIAGTYLAGAASFGSPLMPTPISADVVQAMDEANVDGPSATDGCTALTNGAAVAGKIAIIDRGTCAFVIKVKNAQDAGAVAVIIADNAAGSPPAGLGGADPTIAISSVRVTQADGNTIKAQLANGVQASLSLDMSIGAGFDVMNRAIMNTPVPVVSGSSVSHYDPFASRNLLMEPAINADLTHKVKAPDDLTFELLRDLGWTFPDADSDNVADDEDCEPNSNLSATVIIGGNDTGVPNLLADNGCSIADVIGHIAAASANHGAFASGVAKYTAELVQSGLITGKQKGRIDSAVAKTRFP